MLNRDNVPEFEQVNLGDLNPDRKADKEGFASTVRRSEIIRILVIVLLGVAGLCYYLIHEHQVFPAASIELKRGKSEILQTATEWAKKVGYDKKKTITSTYFSFDGEAKTFLECELGTAKANALMKNEIPVWYWENRICQELQDEECRAAISPGGAPISLRHHIPNDRTIPSLSQDKAEAVAHEFMEKQIGISLANYKSIEKSTNILAHRTDHSFIWQDESREYCGGHLRVSVTVSGNAVSHFFRYLHVPEDWDRKFSTVRTYNNLLASIAGVLSNLLEAAAAIAFVLALSSDNIRWRIAMVMGVIAAIFGFLESLNCLSTINSSYDTTRSYMAFLLQHLLNCGLAPFRMFVCGTGLAAAGEYLYRFFCPEKAAFEKTLSWKGLTAGSVLVAIVLGYALCCVDLGWTAIYYLAGSKMGYWCPLSVENYQVLSSYFPFFGAMCSGVGAASFEEIIYRVAGITLLQRLLKSFWIANLLQSLIWGFMHSTYPQQPCYARGIELTLAGLLYGWIFKRYGLLPCFISHYLFDVYCGVRPLLSSASIFAGWSVAIPLLPFALFGLIGLLLAKKNGRFCTQEEIANRNIPIVKRTGARFDSSEKVPYEYVPLSCRWRLVLLMGAVFSIVCMTVFKGQTAENTPVLKIDRHNALIAARDSLDKHRISRQGMYEVVTLTHKQGYNSSLQYILEKVGFKKTAELHRDLYIGYIWNVRFFKPMDSLEYAVSISGETGKEHEFSITCEEDARGTTITKQAAQKLAEDCLLVYHPQYCPFVFDSTTETKRKHRTDHYVAFKVPKYKVGEADFKVSVAVIGNVVSSVWADWSIPAKWTFEYCKSNPMNEIVTAVWKVLDLLRTAAVLWWGIGIIRSGTIRWRESVICAIPLGLLLIPYFVNWLPLFYAAYTTITPMSTYVSTRLLGYGGGILSGGVSNVLCFGFSLAVLRLLFPKFSFSSLVKTVFKPSGAAEQVAQRHIWLDAVIVSYCMILVNNGRAHLETVLSSLFSPYMHLVNYCGCICSAPNCLNYLLSQIDFSYIIYCCFLPPILMSLYIKYIKSTRMLIILVVLFALLNAGMERYWQEYVIDVFSTLIYNFLLYIFITKLARNNALTYSLWALVVSVISSIAPFVRFGTPVFLSDTLQLIVFASLPVAYVCYLYRGKQDARQVCQRGQ